MSNNIDIKTLEAFQDGNHKAFETVFICLLYTSPSPRDA